MIFWKTSQEIININYTGGGERFSLNFVALFRFSNHIYVFYCFFFFKSTEICGYWVYGTLKSVFFCNKNPS